MAILASLADIAEDRFHVTFRARHCLMHAPQRVARLIVIEFRDRADWPPRSCRVAVLARNVQVSVGTVRIGGDLRPRYSRKSGKRQQHSPQAEHAPARPHDLHLALAYNTIN